MDVGCIVPTHNSSILTEPEWMTRPNAVEFAFGRRLSGNPWHSIHRTEPTFEQSREAFRSIGRIQRAQDDSDLAKKSFEPHTSDIEKSNTKAAGTSDLGGAKSQSSQCHLSVCSFVDTLGE